MIKIDVRVQAHKWFNSIYITVVIMSIFKLSNLLIFKLT